MLEVPLNFLLSSLDSLASCCFLLPSRGYRWGIETKPIRIIKTHFLVHEGMVQCDFELLSHGSAL
jgi:hypothetical protein